jgi:hypothetical protein
MNINIERFKMLDITLEIKVNRIVNQSGFKRSKELICPVMKIVQMRHKDVPKEQASRIINMVLDTKAR